MLHNHIRLVIIKYSAYLMLSLSPPLSDTGDKATGYNTIRPSYRSRVNIIPSLLPLNSHVFHIHPRSLSNGDGGGDGEEGCGSAQKYLGYLTVRWLQEYKKPHLWRTDLCAPDIFVAGLFISTIRICDNRNAV